MSIAKSTILNLSQYFSRSNSLRPIVSRQICFSSTVFRNPEGRSATDEIANKTKQYAHDAKEKAKDSAETATERTKDAAGVMAETGKDAAAKVMDSAHDIGEKAKETTRKMKDKMVGSEDDSDVDQFVEDHIKKPVKEHEKSR